MDLEDFIEQIGACPEEMLDEFYGVGDNFDILFNREDYDQLVRWHIGESFDILETYENHVGNSYFKLFIEREVIDLHMKIVNFPSELSLMAERYPELSVPMKKMREKIADYSSFMSFHPRPVDWFKSIDNPNRLESSPSIRARESGLLRDHLIRLIGFMVEQDMQFCLSGIRKADFFYQDWSRWVFRPQFDLPYHNYQLVANQFIKARVLTPGDALTLSMLCESTGLEKEEIRNAIDYLRYGYPNTMHMNGREEPVKGYFVKSRHELVYDRYAEGYLLMPIID